MHSYSFSSGVLYSHADPNAQTAAISHVSPLTRDLTPEFLGLDVVPKLGARGVEVLEHLVQRQTSRRAGRRDHGAALVRVHERRRVQQTWRAVVTCISYCIIRQPIRTLVSFTSQLKMVKLGFLKRRYKLVLRAHDCRWTNELMRVPTCVCMLCMHVCEYERVCVYVCVCYRAQITSHCVHACSTDNNQYRRHTDLFLLPLGPPRSRACRRG